MSPLRYHEISQNWDIRTTSCIKSVPLPHFQVVFNVNGEHRHSRYISRYISREFELEGFDWIKLDEKTIQFNTHFGLINSKEKMLRALNRGLVGYRLSRSDRENLAKSAVEKAWDILVSSMCPSDNQLNLGIHFIVFHKKVRFDYRIVLRDSTESARSTSTTQQVCIESLKSKIITCLDETCSICLEDFQVGSEGVCTPCSHMFHKNCITRWVMTSRLCLFCRFQMPAS